MGYYSMVLVWLAVANGVAMAAELPVSKVTMFSSGVAYYQRDAQVEGDASAELKFKTEQINDILKSMVLQDLGGGTVSAVTYSSRDPVEKALRSFGVDLTGKPTLAQLLDQLRGAAVRITMPATAKTLSGTILGVQKRRTAVKDTIIEEDVLNVAAADGLLSLVLEPGLQIKLADEQLDGELRKALEVLAASHDAQKKSVVLSFTGQGARPVRVAYMLEAPIWKTSYRLVLSDKDAPFLQGWAIVENTTDEDWNDVELSLVSGRPISFIQDLYQPLYMPRPEVKPELYASLTPQLYGGATEEKEAMAVAEVDADQYEDMAARTLRRARPTRAKAESAGAAPAMAAAPSAPELALAGAGVASMAMAEDVGELFSYKIAAPVSLPRQKSAMLPIVNQEVKAEKVSIYNPEVHAKFPLNGLVLTNSTGLHLMQGPVTVFDDQTYAGDARLDDLQPDEKRMISYAMDLACEGLVISEPEPVQTVSMKLARGTLILTDKYSDKKTYQFTNRDDKKRTVIIEQSVPGDWKLLEPKEPLEKARDVYRFKLEVPGGKTEKLLVHFERIGEQRVLLRETGLEQIQIYLRSKVISKEVKEALSRLAELRQNLDNLQRQRTDREQQVTRITTEQERIRKNMQAVPQNSDTYTRYLRKLDDQETALEKLQSEIDALRKEEEAARKKVEEFLMSIEAG